MFNREICSRDNGESLGIFLLKVGIENGGLFFIVIIIDLEIFVSNKKN